ncbi:MAG TPA: alpha/beta hydrolase [Gammaproteobacteria bacterium]
MATIFLKRTATALVLLLACVACTGVFFHPLPTLVRTPADIGLQYRDIDIQGEAGRLHGWYLPARGKAFGTVLYAHGNAENLSTHIGGVYWLPAAGFNVIIFDYRGYGRSEGEPSARGLVDDTRAFIQYAQTLPEAQAGGLVVYGHSLGGSVLISAVAGMEDTGGIRGMIIESAFSNYRRIAREKLSQFWLTSLLQWTAYLLVTGEPDPLKDIARIEGIPMLIIHSRNDEVIPFSHGPALFAAANEPKQHWWLEDRHHNQGMNDDQRRQFAGYLRAMFQTGSLESVE